MTEEFDDDMLRDALIARSGGSVESNVGRKAVAVRAGRIRTRRAVALGGSATAVVVAGLVMIPLDRDDTDAPSNVVLPAATVGTVTTTAPSSTIEPDRPTTIAEAATTAAADRPASNVDENADADSAPADDPASTAPAGGVTSTLPLSPGPTSITSNPENTTATTGSSDSPATTAPAAPPPTTAPAAPPTTAAPTVAPTTAPATTTSAPTTVPTATVAPSDAPFTQQYLSAGGSITVRWNGVALSLQAVDPLDGFDPEIEDDGASRIRVRFRSDGDDARIDVRASDGKVTVEVS